MEAGLVPLAFVAVSDAVNVPAAEGVPLMRPEPEFIERPAGRPVAANEVGVLEPVTLKLNAVPVVPVAVAALVIAGTFPTVRLTVFTGPVPTRLLALTESV